MGKLLIHLTHGTEAPTQADRAFLIAQTAIKDGHEVSMFLAGEAAKLITNENLDRQHGFGPILRDYYNTIIEGGGKIYLSKMSCESRGISLEELEGKKVELAPPNKLVELSLAADSTITYG
ncbi:DsrE family protein [Niallia sp. JL1B1071]|uniref:DsrE family protein n=1 Tax=Niallia tiangongensis TaxID=3237105 RepID=UPI0037DC5100